MKCSRFIMPTVASVGTWGITGALLAGEKHRKKGLAAGMLSGLVRPSIWKALGKGYAKGVKRPFGELIK